MPRTTLASLTALAVLSWTVACADPTGAPTVEGDLRPSLSFGSPPPPPPDDTMAAAYDEGSASSPYYVRVTYMQNRPGTNGWLSFHPGGVNYADGTPVENSIQATPNARLHFKGDGSVKGTGALTLGGVQLQLRNATLVDNDLGPCAPPAEDEIGTGELDEVEGREPSGVCGGITIRIGTRTLRFAVGVADPPDPIREVPVENRG